jgi:uncharacterized metal-binding protein
MPVRFSCRGCPEFGQAARDVGLILDRQRLAETHWLGAPALNASQLVSTARSRFPVYALDGCAERCAQRWLSSHGVRTERHFILGPGESADALAARIAERIAS